MDHNKKKVAATRWGRARAAKKKPSMPRSIVHGELELSQHRAEVLRSFQRILWNSW